MVDRVCLGRRASGDIGLYISKPGVSVFNTSNDNFLFTHNQRALQIVQSGMLDFSNTTNVSIPNLGFSPKVFAFAHITGAPVDIDATAYIIVTYPNATTINLDKEVEFIPTNGDVTYFVIREPYNG